MSELVVEDHSDGLTDFAAEIADQVESFVIAVREIARGDEPGGAVALLLLEVLAADARGRPARARSPTSSRTDVRARRRS